MTPNKVCDREGMTDDGSFFPPLMFNKFALYYEPLCSRTTYCILCILFLVNQCLHICHYNFDMSIVDAFGLFFMEANKTVYGKKLSGFASIGIFSPTACSNTSVLKLFHTTLVLQMFVYFCLV